MQIGIDSFAAAYDESSRAVPPSERLRNLVEQIEHADDVGLDVFGIGEHHRQEYLDAAPAVILGAAAARTRRIRLTSAVTVLSAADPVRVFQQFATLDLLSEGRAEMVVGRGSSIRKARSAAEDSRQRARALVRQVPPGVDRAGRLSKTRADSVANLARSGRNSAVFRPGRRPRTAPDGRDHRRRTAALPAPDRSVSRNRSAIRTFARSLEGRRPCARIRRRDFAGSRRRVLPWLRPCCH